MHAPSAALPSAAVDGRCPQCAGAVRPDAPWCTQCWADLRPPPEPVAVARPVDPASAPAAPRGLGGWPCSGCGAVNAVELDACAACGTGFLAGLRREEPPLLVLPGVGDVTRLSRGQRLGLAGAVVLVIVLLVALLSVLTG